MRFVALILVLPTLVFAQRPSDSPGSSEKGNPVELTKPVPPSAESLEKSFAIIQDLFKQQIHAAKTPAQKVDLAAMLLSEARETQGDPAGQYALLVTARDVAAGAGEIDKALLAASEIDKRFQIDELAMRVDVLSQIAKLTRTAEQHRELALVMVEAMDQSILTDRFQLHRLLGELAQASAERIRDAKLQQTIAERIQEADELEQQQRQLGPSLKVLESNPDDATANGVVGRYRCFVNGNWDNGLPHLAVSDELVLQQLAADSLQNIGSHVDLADRWWNIASERSGVRRKNVERFAVAYYQKALPELTGLSKRRVTALLDEFDDREAHGLSGTKDTWIVVFRSADPSLWNTDINDERGMAIPLQKVPSRIRYLRMSTDRDNVVIIPITKRQLGQHNDNESARFNWTGESWKGWNAHHLGIYDKQMGFREGGDVILAPGPLNRGWGFGHRRHLNDRQGYSWDGAPLDATVFEIAVKSGDLTRQEQSFLLRN